MNANAKWLQYPPVQSVCDAQRKEADRAKWALEFLESDIAKLGHFYMEVGEGHQHGGCIERKSGRYVTKRWTQESRWRDPQCVETEHDSLLNALEAFTGEA